MSTKKYNNSFNLTPKDVQIIEESLRIVSEQLAAHEIQDKDHIPKGEMNDQCESDLKLRDINSLLGKLHNQKIFYSQTHRKPGTPLG